MEKIFTTIPPDLAGSNVIVGFGEIESDQLLVLEQIVVDNEITHYCERIAQGVNTGEGNVLTNDVIKVGPSGNFLALRTTRSAARSDEYYLASLVDRQNREAWLEPGIPFMYSNARQKVIEILNAPLMNPIPESVLQKLDGILDVADIRI